MADIIYATRRNKTNRWNSKTIFKRRKEVNTVEEAIQGALDIIAENISDEAKYRKLIKSMCFREAIISTKATKEEEKSNYEMYYDYSEGILRIPSHRILAINRGEKEEFLKSKTR